MSSIEVNTLPIVEELFEDDFVLVQSKGRTVLIKFEDFVVGEQQVSFYKEIVDARNSIDEIIQRLDGLDTSVSELQTTIQEIQETSATDSGKVNSVEQQITDSNEQITLNTGEIDVIKQSIEAVETSVQNLADEGSRTPLEEQSSKISTLEATNQNFTDLLNKVQTDLTALKSDINNVNTQIYTQGARITDLGG